MIYICRQRGAQGLATIPIVAETIEEFQAKHPELEPLAAFTQVKDANRELLYSKMHYLTLREAERGR